MAAVVVVFLINEKISKLARVILSICHLNAYENVAVDVGEAERVFVETCSEAVPRTSVAARASDASTTGCADDHGFVSYVATGDAPRMTLATGE